MSADDQRAADDEWTPIPGTAACPAECEDCQVTVDRLRAELAETRAKRDQHLNALSTATTMYEAAMHKLAETRRVGDALADQAVSAAGLLSAPAAGPGGTSVVRSGVGRGFPRVHGRCPACRSASLFLAVGDHVTCASLSCPNPTAVADQLDGTVEDIAAEQAPAVELPVTLSSPDDVAAVCFAHGLTTLEEERAWQTQLVLVMTDHDDVDGRLNSYCVYRSGNDEPMVAIQPHAPSAVLVAAIEAARGGSR